MNYRNKRELGFGDAGVWDTGRVALKIRSGRLRFSVQETHPQPVLTWTGCFYIPKYCIPCSSLPKNTSYNQQDQQDH